MEYNFNVRPYIVINGINSQTIPGLIVSKLPPVTKPQIRTRAETVDGRDGDIITTLGYNAYNKEIEIGLANEYDVDDVIRFFNSTGKIVFSNEPDKYYIFSIYETIDFEKLIRFKKAKVKLHVQPFKYSDSESERTFIRTPGEVVPVTIRNNGNIYSRPTISVYGAGTVKIYLNSIQILSLSLASTGQEIIIDAQDMNAYNYDRSALLNRKVVGNYDNIRLEVGRNTITYSGTVSEIRIDKYTRWI